MAVDDLHVHVLLFGEPAIHAEKLSGEQVATTNPTPPGDRIILHADEREKDKRKQAEEQASTSGLEGGKPQDEEKPEPGKKPPNQAGHIDITV